MDPLIPAPPAPGLVKTLPDVAEDSVATHPAVLARAGMSEIEMLLRRPDPHGNGSIGLPARGDVYVSIDDPQVRGIHMSRLYLTIQRILERDNLSWPLLAEAIAECRHSHRSFVKRAFLTLRSEWLIRRTSLVSGLEGWRSYPVEFAVSIGGSAGDDAISRELAVTVMYSSACPCSTALSGRLAEDRFLDDFSGLPWISPARVGQWLAAGGGNAGIPHSQRSLGKVRVRLAPHLALPIGDDGRTLPRSTSTTQPGQSSGELDSQLVRLIDRVEAALTTPVQGAVKRADEQEFARLNGAQPMFCEDAARRMRTAVEGFPDVTDYRIEARHLESLHPHDAVAVAVRGVPGGFFE